MKSFRKELMFNVKSRRAYIDITDEVVAALRESGIKEGLLLCNAMHITASVYINDHESGLIQDYDNWLEQLAPHEPLSRYNHNPTGNAMSWDAKSSSPSPKANLISGRGNASITRNSTDAASSASSLKSSGNNIG